MTVGIGRHDSAGRGRSRDERARCAPIHSAVPEGASSARSTCNDTARVGRWSRPSRRSPRDLRTTRSRSRPCRRSWCGARRPPSLPTRSAGWEAMAGTRCSRSSATRATRWQSASRWHMSSSAAHRSTATGHGSHRGTSCLQGRGRPQARSPRRRQRRSGPHPQVVLAELSVRTVARRAGPDTEPLLRENVFRPEASILPALIDAIAMCALLGVYIAHGFAPMRINVSRRRTASTHSRDDQSIA